MGFPSTRLRRLRRSGRLRELFAETHLEIGDLIAPLFVGERAGGPVASMPGVVVHDVGSLTKEAGRLAGVGIPAVLIFGVPTDKDPKGKGAWAPDGIVQRALEGLREEVGDSLVLMADLCLDEYTDHGHCGVLTPSGEVDNDATLELYRRVAVAQAVAGADLVAPSGMMDGQVAAIRDALDDCGHTAVGILAYAAKYASSLYGPFREAAGVTFSGDRRSYQLDVRNRREAIREVALDVAEGADVIMVKPALPCLDVIAEVRRRFDLPIAAYQVSGEYAMLKAAAERGWLDGPAAELESLLAIRRAGADLVVTYLAGEAAELLGG